MTTKQEIKQLRREIAELRETVQTLQSLINARPYVTWTYPAYSPVFPPYDQITCGTCCAGLPEKDQGFTGLRAPKISCDNILGI